MRKVAGLTLIELLVAAMMFALVAVALSRAFWFALRYEVNAPAQRERFASQIRFEDRLRAILQQAYISSSTSDLTTYVIGTEGGQNPNGSPNLTAAMAAPGTAAATATNTATTSTGSPNTGGNSDGIVLTVIGQQIPPNYLQATGVPMTDTNADTSPTGGVQNFQQSNSMPNGQTIESDLEQLNADFGAQGGVTEISITQTPVGDPGQYNGALYIRTQRPADADYTQGGTEQVFDDGIQKLQFEFFDGLNWDGGWDTTQSGMHYLPAAIRVHYWLKTDPDTEHIFVVRIPLSTLTPQNPLGSASTGSSTTTGTRTGTPGTGGAGGTGRPGTTPQALPGILPLFSNLRIEPETAAGSPPALNGSDPGQVPAKPAVPDWRKPPGQFQYIPENDPLLAPANVAEPQKEAPAQRSEVQKTEAESTPMPASPNKPIEESKGLGFQTGASEKGAPR